MESRAARGGIFLAVLALTVVAYFNAVPGEFVYDDDIQIVQNPYIQHSRLLGTALLSDVWAFKGETGEAWSNYWRPTFILWLTLNHRLFGLDPAGWHMTSLALHLVVLALAAGVLARLGVGLAVSAAVLAVFAVHPAHVESVAWISGSPDLLVSAFWLGSFVVYLSNRSVGRVSGRIASLALCACALLSKEVAVLFPVFIVATEWALLGDGRRTFAERLRRALRVAAPYFGLAVLFLLARWAVLGTMARTTPWSPGLASQLMSVPEVLGFYLRQALWPATLSPAYPLRAVDPGALVAADLLWPLLIIAAAAVALALVRRDPIAQVGLALFLLPLAPAMNISAFLPEQIVHDRYLYLPLLGLALVVFQAIARLTPAGDRAVVGMGVVAAAALTFSTHRYNRVWLDNASLWERAVEVDPRSSHTWSQLGNIYRKAGRLPEAKEALERAEAVDPTVTQLILDLGIIAASEGRHEEAERRFQRVLAAYPSHEVALDQLGGSYAGQGRVADAEAVFRRARELLPYRRIKYTMNLAVLAQQTNRSDVALAELETLMADLQEETDPAMLRAYMYLGELYRDRGRAADARRMYEAYLRRTEGLDDANTVRMREMATGRLSTSG